MLFPAGNNKTSSGFGPELVLYDCIVLKFRREVEPDVRKFLLGQRQRVRSVCKEDFAAVLVERHAVELPFAEILHLRLVIRLDPAGFVHLHRFVAAQRAVFVFEPVLNLSLIHI